ncbi:hypothetical protein BPAE_0017g00760 [Botrytis paeoniae]|uniref:Uncharacterized protein n=1 Tax=Botrytis paeoniae TaxID=278948 RepID=A0A4Z1G038_9HELO|nr:hypothetical protein BPAE_0017g00760 [Botrytis paeoniae]
MSGLHGIGVPFSLLNALDLALALVAVPVAVSVPFPSNWKKLEESIKELDAMKSSNSSHANGNY